MRTRIAIACVVLAAGLCLASVDRTRVSTDLKPVAPARPTASIGDETPLGPLARCIQERFENLDSQGLTRIPMAHEAVKLFRPGTSEEKAAVDRLRDDGVEVGFYLGGRRLLEPAKTRKDWEDPARRHHPAMSGPVIVTGEGAADDFPDAWDLREHGKKALLAPASVELTTGTLGRWTIEARPVRADRQACLDCHKSRRPSEDLSLEELAEREERPSELKIGDALGVMIYVHAKTPR